MDFSLRQVVDFFLRRSEMVRPLPAQFGPIKNKFTIIHIKKLENIKRVDVGRNKTINAKCGGQSDDGTGNAAQGPPT